MIELPSLEWESLYLVDFCKAKMLLSRHVYLVLVFVNIESRVLLLLAKVVIVRVVHVNLHQFISFL